MECKGNGECYELCACECVDEIEYMEEGEEHSLWERREVCTCGHREPHEAIDGGEHKYHKSDCTFNCKLKACSNFRICGNRYPRCWFQDSGNRCQPCISQNLNMMFISNRKIVCHGCNQRNYESHLSFACFKHKFCYLCAKEGKIVEKMGYSCPDCNKRMIRPDLRKKSTWLGRDTSDSGASGGAGTDSGGGGYSGSDDRHVWIKGDTSDEDWRMQLGSAFGFS